MTKRFLFGLGAVVALACAFAALPHDAVASFLAFMPPDGSVLSPFLGSPDLVEYGMAALAANQLREYQMGDKEEYPVTAATLIYQGAAVGEDAAGAARGLQAGDVFLGFAEAKADNTDGAAGAIRVNVRKRGNIVLDIAGVTVAVNNRAPVYASDDNTFTLTATANSLIGYVSRYEGNGKAVVEFDSALCKAALQA